MNNKTMEEFDRELLLKLLSKNHAEQMQNNAGGAVMCICGQSCGGTPECSAYKVLLHQLETCINALESISGGFDADWMIRRANIALKGIERDGY